ncbi:ribosome biogenesis protein ytm1 [Mycoemilia scoparia]|uniref:Ribosome biogenesis protein ytm1 n=1 Tax=Mycoemilia scoparia TaxID=417184 RepID=A0A9W8A6C3_9FUNG|nr:ribosome biogenesis protein ytm1 [Mycoemilia scoparia]
MLLASDSPEEAFVKALAKYSSLSDESTRPELNRDHGSKVFDEKVIKSCTDRLDDSIKALKNEINDLLDKSYDVYVDAIADANKISTDSQEFNTILQNLENEFLDEKASISGIFIPASKLGIVDELIDGVLKAVYNYMEICVFNFKYPTVYEKHDIDNDIAELSFTTQKDGKSALTLEDYKDIYCNITAILEFTSRNIFGPVGQAIADNASIPDHGSAHFMCKFGKEYSKLLFTQIIGNRLYSQLPNTHSDFMDYKKYLDESIKFEDKLVKLNFLPKDAGISPVSDDNDVADFGAAQLRLIESSSRPFSWFSINAAVYYVIHKRDRMYVDICRLIELKDFSELDLHHDEAISKEWLEKALGPDDSALDKAADRIKNKLVDVFPRCIISKCAYHIVTCAYSLAVESLEFAGKPSYQLLLSAHSLFDLFRVLRNAYHGDIFKQTPGLSIMFYNDCIYLSHHLQTICNIFQTDPKTQSDKTSIETGMHTPQDPQPDTMSTSIDSYTQISGDMLNSAKKLQDLADDTIKLLSDRESRKIIRLLPAANDTAPDPNQSINAPIEEIRNLARLIQPVTTLHSEILNERCRRFEKLIDTILEPPKSTHKDKDDASPIRPPTSEDGPEPIDFDDDELLAFYVPSWFKFQQLTDILLMSMSEIMARYRSGLLNDFSPDHLQGLLEALFVESGTRTNNIAIIQRKSSP